jgi:hypothetical protein
VGKTEIEKSEFKVWCEHCSIRVAPNEEKTVVAGKTYHSQCYPKAAAKSKARTPTIPA